jgi:hypothetical protein
MQPLIVQITTRQTRQLIVSLGKWPTIETKIFLDELLDCMPQKWDVYPFFILRSL